MKSFPYFDHVPYLLTDQLPYPKKYADRDYRSKIFEKAHLDQLFDFLRDTRSDVRQLAVQHVAGLTASKEYFAYFDRNDCGSVQDLMKLVQDEPVSNRSVSHISGNCT